MDAVKGTILERVWKMMIKGFVGKIFAAACALLILSMSGALCVVADTVPDGAAQDGNGEKEAQRLMIREPGTYTLTGSMKGTVYVDPGKGDVKLILDNADIEGVSEPAIMAVSGDSLTIEMKERSYNRLADTGNNVEDAAVLSLVDTTFRGCGCLQTEGNKRFGIRTEEADLTFARGKYLFVSKETGIVMDGQNAGTLYLTGGCVFVNAGKDPSVKAEFVKKTAGMLEETKKTDVRKIDCCWEGDCKGCCCSSSRKCRKPVADEEDDDDDKCDCRESDVDHPGPIVKGTVSNEAVALEKSDDPVTIVFGEEKQQVTVSEPGTYHISGTCGNGSITVMKDIRGAVLVLENLNLTNQSGAALTIGSSAVVKIFVSGNVSLTEAIPADDITPTDGSDVTEPAVVKAEAGSEVCITGDGVLTVDGKTGDGIAMKGDATLVIDGTVDMNVQAASDGIRAEKDIAVLSGKVEIQAGDHGIHADHVVTIGEENGTGPDVQITESREGIEGAVVNIESGTVAIESEEDGIGAEEPADGTTASVNMTGGEVKIHSGENGIDSDGNVNLIDGKAEIDSKGEDGSCNCVDADGDLYISEEFTLDCGCEEEN